MKNTITRKKIGLGFYPEAYGFSYQKKAIIYLIDGKAYAKSYKIQEYQPAFPNDKGLIRVNQMDNGEFSQVSTLEIHKDYIG